MTAVTGKLIAIGNSGTIETSETMIGIAVIVRSGVMIGIGVTAMSGMIGTIASSGTMIGAVIMAQGIDTMIIPADTIIGTAIMAIAAHVTMAIAIGMCRITGGTRTIAGTM